MEDGKKYKVTMKINNAWQTLGNIAKNKYDRWSLGLRVTPELKSVINGTPDGTWVNMSLLEVTPKSDKPEEPKDEF